MNKAIRTHNPRAMELMILLAVLLMLVVSVFVLQPAAMTGDREGNPAVSAQGAGGSSLTHNPYVDRHAEVVAYYQEDGVR